MERGMNSTPWKMLLRAARARPAFYIGNEANAHLSLLERSLRLFWGGVFLAAEAVRLVVSPTQFWMSCDSGPLISQLDGLLTRKESDNVIETLRIAANRVRDESIDGPDWPQCLRYVPLFSPACALLLADRGVFGIRLRAGLWCQAYRRGSPQSPPQMVEPESSVGLVVVAALSPRWFHGLPYTLESVRRALVGTDFPAPQLEYRGADDLIGPHQPAGGSLTDWL
jgi:hypothetical protein